MPSIIIKDTEHFDIGLRKFKRACEKAAIVPEIRASCLLYTSDAADD